MIENIIKHFGLTKESEDRFLREYKNKFIPYSLEKEFKNSKDLRIRKKLDFNILEKLDKGWDLFQDKFYYFIYKNNIKYLNFKNNKIKEGKNTLKLFKALNNFYNFETYEGRRNIYIQFFLMVNNEDECFLQEKKVTKEEVDAYFNKDIEVTKYRIETLIKNLMQEIISCKLPKEENLEIVLSLNFDDWFLSASFENWSSCLNVESNYNGATWSGLPGLIVDKNRALLYITNGRKKRFQGIEVDSILARSWVLLDEFDRLNFVRWFPFNPLKNEENLKNIFNIPIISITPDFYSKYDFELLRFNTIEKHSCFIYQDNTCFKQNYQDNFRVNLIYNSEENGGLYYINEFNQNYMPYTIFNYSNGLTNLIKNDKIITSYLRKDQICYSCEEEYDESEMTFVYDEWYCNNCFNDIFIICDNCGEIIDKDEAKYMDFEILCNYCYSH